MVCQPIRLALLIGAITAVAVSPARASHGSSSCGSCGSTAPAFRTITTTECVPETYTVKRVSYRVECRTEQYDTCRTECVPVCKERVCTVTKRVPVVTTQMQKRCSYTTTYVDRCVTKYNYSYVNETCMKKKCVSRGHWECQCVPVHSFFAKHHTDPCNPCCTPTKMKKVWVSCPEYIDCPVTVCKKVCTPYQVTCKVPVCTPVWTECPVQVCTYNCVNEQVVQKYTCYETRTIPCKATRTVRVCVPCEENVTCTRMVARQVCRQVPVTECCNAAPTTCCSPAPACCPAPTCCPTTSCCGSKPRKCGGLFSGRSSRCGGHHATSDCCR